MRILIAFYFFVAIFISGCQSSELSVVKSSHQQLDANNPWAGFGKGSYVHYKIMRPSDSAVIEQKQTVVDVLPAEILLETSTLVNDEWRSEGVTEYPLAVIAKPGIAVAFSEEVVKVGKHEIDCKVMSHELTMGEHATIYRAWVSREVPGGVVKKEMAGVVVWELLEFLKK